MNNMQSLPETGFIRVSQIIGDAKRGYPALIPISRTSWWKGVKEGRFPQPIHLGPKTVVWRIEDIRNLIQQAA
ncbi:MAG: AlpA family phage regulatory protein [Gallionella sp.]